MKAWKRAEKEAAKALGGLRRWRVMYSESVGDIIHPVLSIEVKYGKQIPKSVVCDNPMVLTVGGCPKYVVIASRQKKKRWVHKEKRLKFLERGINQALSYDATKKPVLVMKPTRFCGMIFCMRWEDWCDRAELFKSATEGQPRLR